MAELGFRKFEEMIGQADLLEMNDAIEHWKSHGLDFTKILFKADVSSDVAIRNVCTQDLSGDIGEGSLDRKLIRECQPALEDQKTVRVNTLIGNMDRATGAMLSYEISKRYEEKGLPEDTIRIDFKGSAGQSFGAFLAPGVTFTLSGDANDYVGKGLSGGNVVVFPASESPIIPEENIIIGNVALYGAIAGQAFFRGIAGERFAVRNSGAKTVVEGVGDHGCEYMTGGCVVVLGETGRNFAAGMSGGIAYVLDREGQFDIHCNKSGVDLVPVEEKEDIEELKSLISEHQKLTGSTLAEKILGEWETMLPKFVKVFPTDYRRVLEERKKKLLEEVA